MDRRKRLLLPRTKRCASRDCSQLSADPIQIPAPHSIFSETPAEARIVKKAGRLSAPALINLLTQLTKRSPDQSSPYRSPDPPALSPPSSRRTYLRAPVAPAPSPQS